MFLVFNKQKIFSYIIAFTTVITLLGMAKIYTNKSAEIMETFSKAKVENEIDKKEEENEISKSTSLKDNCLQLSEKWSDNDINQLLLILKKYNISVNFYITKDWKNKHNASVNQITNYGHNILEVDE